jgi:hypothetical protein
MFALVQYLEGKDLELHASRQVGLLDFIASALPASHSSKPGACQVTVYLLCLLRVLLSLPANRTYFLVQNLLPPIIPMLSASLENYIKVAASNSGSSNPLSSKPSTENTESIGEVLDGFLWTVTMIVGHVHFNDDQLQMQGGLIELIVAYQIIHRLRDLLALYDRPQVEGSPLPSSILFGLNLLAVLTSKPGNFSSIDWDSCRCRALGGLVREHEYLHSQDRMGNQLMAPDQSEDAKVYRKVTEENRSSEQHVLGFPDDMNNSEIRSSDIGVPTELLSEIPSQGDETSTAERFIEARKVNNVCSASNDSPAKANEANLKQPGVLVLSAMAETGLVSLPSLLTAVLLQANNRSSSEQVCATTISKCNIVLFGEIMLCCLQTYSMGLRASFMGLESLVAHTPLDY